MIEHGYCGGSGDDVRDGVLFEKTSLTTADLYVSIRATKPNKQYEFRGVIT